MVVILSVWVPYSRLTPLPPGGAPKFEPEGGRALPFYVCVCIVAALGDLNFLLNDVFRMRYLTEFPNFWDICVINIYICINALMY